MIEDIRNPSDEIPYLTKRIEVLEKGFVDMADKLNEVIAHINKLEENKE